MDSLTQLVLGGAVAVIGLGRAIGPRRAALVGGLLGTLPDLDVVIRYADPVDSFTLHRGFSHSLLIQALLTPLIAELLRRVLPGPPGRARLWLTVYLCLATHALLDAMTVYGTQLLWPLSREPFGVGSVFIIDPLYTLPLLAAFLWAALRKDWSARLGRATALALVVSTAYLGWSALAQRLALREGERALQAAGIEPARLLATPTPFNTLLWRVIAMDGAHYHNLYVPAFGGAEELALLAHPSGAALADCLDGSTAFRRLAAFSHGFWRLDQVDGRIVFSDLRMGLTPNYVFRFALAERDAAGFAPIAPERLRQASRSAPGDLDWLLGSLAGAVAVRPAEASALASAPPSAAAACAGQ